MTDVEASNPGLIAPFGSLLSNPGLVAPFASPLSNPGRIAPFRSFEILLAQPEP